MAPLNPSEISIFLDKLEFSTGYQFSNRDIVSLLLEQACREHKTYLFEDLIFHAKFIVKTREVMNRIGQKTEGYEKLAVEIQTSVDHAANRIRMLIESTEQKEEFEKRFLVLETESFSRFINLLSDLSWIKNWQIDGNLLPCEPSSSKKIAAPIELNLQTVEIEQRNQRAKSLSLVQRSAILTGILLIVFLILDPPATILGWVLSLWIAVLLVYIVLQIVWITRNQNS